VTTVVIYASASHQRPPDWNELRWSCPLICTSSSSWLASKMIQRWML